jgi:hypothetical protein
MDDIVSEYQAISDEHIDSMVFVEALILVISCFVFFIELAVVGTFIIRAVIRTHNELQDEPDSDHKTIQTKKYKKMKKGKSLLFLLLLATFFYLVSVASVAIATVIGQSTIQITLDFHVADGARINVSGRQRMLSQCVVLDTMVISSF